MMKNRHSLADAAKLLRPVPDFPKEGILFWDIQPLLREVSARKACIADLMKKLEGVEFDVIAGFDARGFIFGTMLADEYEIAFEQIRKKGKLPGKTKQFSYDLEYGSNVLEMIDDGYIKDKRVLLVDDILATGGTALAGCELVESLGGTVVGLATIVDLPELYGRGKLMRYPVYTAISIIENQPVVNVEYCVDVVTAHLCYPDYTILVKRLSEPTGYALPGGHIETNESPDEAVRRELSEETGLFVTGGLEFWMTLSGLNRDPRGPKVSLVFFASCLGNAHDGEPEKTRVVNRPKPLTDIPASECAFDMHEVFRMIEEHNLANAA